jgi:hypothetical protein
MARINGQFHAGSRETEAGPTIPIVPQIWPTQFLSHNAKENPPSYRRTRSKQRPVHRERTQYFGIIFASADGSFEETGMQ